MVVYGIPLVAVHAWLITCDIRKMSVQNSDSKERKKEERKTKIFNGIYFFQTDEVSEWAAPAGI